MCTYASCRSPSACSTKIASASPPVQFTIEQLVKMAVPPARTPSPPPAYPAWQPTMRVRVICTTAPGPTNTPPPTSPFAPSMPINVAWHLKKSQRSRLAFPLRTQMPPPELDASHSSNRTPAKSAAPPSRPIPPP
eukprot:1506496-Pleurochrysis_carterae.AAC.2